LITLTFELALLHLMHESDENQTQIAAQPDKNYKTSIFKSCQKKVNVNLEGVETFYTNLFLYFFELTLHINEKTTNIAF